MPKNKNQTINKKDIIIYSLIAIQFILISVLAVSLYNTTDNLRSETAIISNHDKLVREAQFKCLEETGGLDCDYVKTHEELRAEFIEAVAKGDIIRK